MSNHLFTSLSLTFFYHSLTYELLSMNVLFSASILSRWRRFVLKWSWSLLNKVFNDAKVQSYRIYINLRQASRNVHHLQREEIWELYTLLRSKYATLFTFSRLSYLVELTGSKGLRNIRNAKNWSSIILWNTNFSVVLFYCCGLSGFQRSERVILGQNHKFIELESKGGNCLNKRSGPSVNCKSSKSRIKLIIP